MKKSESDHAKNESGAKNAAPLTAAAAATIAAEEGPLGTGEVPMTLEAALLTPEQLDQLKSRAASADECRDRLLRTAADFDNFKKRAARERQDAINYANQSLIQKLLPVLDHFEMARAAAAKQGTDEGTQSLQAGIAMIYQQIHAVLAEAGLEEVDATGKTFDPNFHEAVSQKETPELPDGQVVQQLRKGYRLRDRLLRPAAVIVSKKASSRA